MNIYLSDKKVILILILLVLLTILSLVYITLPKVSTSNLTDFSSSKKQVDLTKGKTYEFEGDTSGSYVEQETNVCNQQNLESVFGNTINNTLKPVKYVKLPSSYGETNWWYTIKGTISNIEPKQNKIIYSLENKDTMLKISATPGKTNIGLNEGPRNLGKLKDDSLIIGDKVIFYLAVKCGGGRLPLLTIHVIDDPSFVLRNK